MNTENSSYDKYNGYSSLRAWIKAEKNRGKNYMIIAALKQKRINNRKKLFSKK